MSVIVEFWRCEGPRVVGNWMYISIGVNGQDCAQDVVRGVGFHNDLLIRHPVGEDRSSGECLFQVLESSTTFLGESPRDVFSSEAYKWDCYLQVVLDETVVKVSKFKEGLNVLGSGQSWIVLTLSCAIEKPVGKSTYPRYSTESVLNSHLSAHT